MTTYYPYYKHFNNSETAYSDFDLDTSTFKKNLFIQQFTIKN